MRPILEVFTGGPFQENTYLLGDTDARVAIVIDPGGRAQDVVHVAAQRGVRVMAIVNTHSHIDHVTGVEVLRELTRAPFWLHRVAAVMLDDLPEQASMFGLPPVSIPTVDDFLAPNQVISVGGIRLTVRETPGHAPGHVTLITQPLDLDDGLAPRAFVGDVIFMGSIGRTDLPGGDYDLLMTSIETEILTLPAQTVLYSGHGPATTVGHERRYNPFVRDWLAHRGGPG